MVEGDREKIDVVVTNLVRNALTFTDPDGQIGVKAEGKAATPRCLSSIPASASLPARPNASSTGSIRSNRTSPPPWRDGPRPVDRQGDGRTARRPDLVREQGRHWQSVLLHPPQRARASSPTSRSSSTPDCPTSAARGVLRCPSPHGFPFACVRPAHSGSVLSGNPASRTRRESVCCGHPGPSATRAQADPSPPNGG